MDASRIAPRLWLGRAPADAAALRALRDDLGVTAVLNLQTAADMRAGRFDLPAREIAHAKLGVVLCWVPIVDLDDASLRDALPRAVAALDELRRGPPEVTVFVHCSAGVERSPTVVAAYLASRAGHDLDEAVTLIRSARPIAAPRVATIRASGVLAGKRR
jgi:protein-tyrosine phosphatase